MITRTQRFKPDVAQMVTDTIVEALEKGVVPWKQPWRTEMPKNLISRRPYQGINLLLLSLSPYSSPYYLTFNQVEELGGMVKAGSKGFRIVYWRLLEHLSPEGEITDIPLLRYYVVFNLEQCSGISLGKVPKAVLPDCTPIEACEEIVNGMEDKPKFIDTPDAYYERTSDTIGMPVKALFNNMEEYYSTLFHELTHATGHPKRLNRLAPIESKAAFNEEYTKEELVAELGSSILCAHARISPMVIDNQASYIANWLGHLKNDKRYIISAAAAAQKAAYYVLGDYEEIDLNNCTWRGDYHECY